ncbi:MAG: acyl-protein synthetase, partial [Deltaproteobacteria bacterium]|nr:acyl-protein synthetase [Deltaproteobacteria bacterium]
EIPPWTRITVVDTGQFERLPKGEIGLLRYCDLTNRVLGIAVQTDMLGFETDHGFKAIGRWNRELRDIGVDASVGHPGGRLVTGVFTYLMRRNMSKVGKVYSRLM